MRRPLWADALLAFMFRRRCGAQSQRSIFGTSSHASELKKADLERFSRPRGMRRDEGIPIDLPQLDELTNGVHTSELLLMAGRPSVGKTAFVAHVTSHLAVRRGIRTLLFTPRYGKSTLVDRLLGVESCIDIRPYRFGVIGPAHQRQDRCVLQRISEAPIFVDDRPVIGIGEVCHEASVFDRQNRRERSLIVLEDIDYLDEARDIKTGAVDRRGIHMIVASLRDLARRLRCAVIATIGLPLVEHDDPRRQPQVYDLRRLGVSEEDTDTLAFLYRVPSKAESTLLVTRQPFGPSGIRHVPFSVETGTFNG